MQNAIPDLMKEKGWKPKDVLRQIMINGDDITINTVKKYANPDLKELPDDTPFGVLRKFADALAVDIRVVCGMETEEV